MWIICCVVMRNLRRSLSNYNSVVAIIASIRVGFNQKMSKIIKRTDKIGIIQ